MRKFGFLLGSILGSIAGLLFARESGATFRARLGSARTPQKKFEVLFQEYLKVGKEVFSEIKESELIEEVITGGREIMQELQTKAKTESSSAIKLAQRKAAEIVREAERSLKPRAIRSVRQVVKTAKKITKKATPTRRVTKAKTKPVAKKTTSKKPAKAKTATRRTSKKTSR